MSRRLAGVALVSASILGLACATNKPIQVRSTPSGADVYVDGKRFGTTPTVVTTNDLLPRRAFDGKASAQAVMVIEKPGFKSYQIVLQEFGLPSGVNAELQPNAPAAQTSAAGSVYDELAKLQDLRDRGTITEAEFQSLKKKALEKANSTPPPI